MILVFFLTMVFPLMARILTHDQRLLEAAKEGDNAKVRSLLQGGVPVETVDEYKRTALMLAAQAGNTQTIQVLLDFGANIDARNELGATPLMLASLSGKVDVVRLLAEDGADVNAQSQNGLTPLMLAVVKRESMSLFIAQLLIERGANVNVTDQRGWTALMHGIFAPPPPPPPLGSKKVVDRRLKEVHSELAIQIGLVKLLIKAGSNLSIKNADGHTAESLAIACQQHRIVELLRR